MSHTIVNLSDWPVSIRLNTGVTRHLRPGASLPGLSSAEIGSNSQVEKLARRRLIALRASGAGPRSRDMSANEAVEHIRTTALGELGDFMADDEDRVTVLRAFEEKRGS